VDLVGFLDEVIAPYPKKKEIHVILDNHSAHKAPAVEEWLQAHPNFRFRFHLDLRLVAQPGSSFST
jgi:hypothetical protein